MNFWLYNLILLTHLFTGHRVCLSLCLCVWVIETRGQCHWKYCLSLLPSSHCKSKSYKGWLPLKEVTLIVLCVLSWSSYLCTYVPSHRECAISKSFRVFNALLAFPLPWIAFKNILEPDLDALACSPGWSGGGGGSLSPGGRRSAWATNSCGMHYVVCGISVTASDGPLP